MNTGVIIAIVFIILLIIGVAVGLSIFFFRRKSEEEVKAALVSIKPASGKDPITKGGSNVLYFGETIQRGPYSLTLNATGLVYSDGKTSRTLVLSKNTAASTETLQTGSFAIIQSIGHLTIFDNTTDYNNNLWNSSGAGVNNCCTDCSSYTGPFSVFLTSAGVVIQALQNNSLTTVCTL
jgi:hypothetical protein